MRILYLGDDNPWVTSAHRAATLRRMGHDVTLLNPRAPLPRGPFVGGVSTRIGFSPFVPWVNAALHRRIGNADFDLVWVDGGPELGPKFYRWLRQRTKQIINYVCDDPFGGRDGHKWDLYRAALPHHDLTIVVRPPNVGEAERAGAKQVMRVFMSYDSVAHAALPLNEVERRIWRSEVIFVGTWMPERGPFMVSLLDAGVPLTIRGDRWEKAPEYNRLRAVIRGEGVYGPDYVKSIQCAKVALGLLSKGNRDLHTQRSAEVPYIGGAIYCAERTSEHEAMFRDGVEALLWNTASQCAAACHRILEDEQRRLTMVSAAKRRIVELGLDNETVLRGIILKLSDCTTDVQND